MSEAPSPFAPRRRGRGKQFPDKREAVLNAAAALIARRGYAGTSLNELADILGVTKPTLYHYVGGKEQLYAEIVERSQRMTIDFIAAVADLPASGLERLRRILVGYIEIVNSDAGACALFTATPDVGAATQAAIRARAREANALIYRVLREGAEDGTIRPLDPPMVLNTVFGAANWTPNWFRPGGRLTLGEFAKAQAEILLGGVAAVRQPNA